MGSVKIQVISSQPTVKRYTIGCASTEQYRKPQTKIAKLVQKTDAVLGLDKSLGFDKIRDECVKQGGLYEDPDFPCTDQSVFQSFWPWPGRSIVWKRPGVGFLYLIFLHVTASAKHSTSL